MSKETDPAFFLCVGMCLRDVDMALDHAEQMDKYAGDAHHALAVQIGTRLLSVKRLLTSIYQESAKTSGGDANG